MKLTPRQQENKTHIFTFKIGMETKLTRASLIYFMRKISYHEMKKFKSFRWGGDYYQGIHRYAKILARK